MGKDRIATRDFINVPKVLVEKYRGSKESLESLAVAIILKSKYGDSTMRNFKIKNIIETFHVGKIRAKRIYGNVTANQQLFSCDTTNDTVTAKTFKNCIIKSQNRYGKDIHKCYCLKIEVKDCTSINNIMQSIRLLMFANIVDAKNRKDKSKLVGRNSNEYLCGTNEALTQNKIANYVGINRSTLYRNTKKWEKQGLIVSTPAKYKFNIHNLSEEDIIGLFIINDKKNKRSYLVTPKSFVVTSRKISEGSTNIIFDHNNRLTHNINSAKYSNVELYFTMNEH